MQMNKENSTIKAAGVKGSPQSAGREYNEIDWPGLPAKTASITVLYSRAPAIAAAILYIIFGGLTLMLLFGNGFTNRAAFLVVANAGILALVVYLQVRAKRRAVKSFDAMGVLTRKGQRFLWTDFRGRIVRTGKSRYGRSYTWRTELVFTGNRQLWVLPQRVKNLNEISLFLETLPLATLKDIPE